jgi:hypothetical protein
LLSMAVKPLRGDLFTTVLMGYWFSMVINS